MASLAVSAEADVEGGADLGKRNTFLTLDMKRNSASDLTELSELCLDLTSASQIHLHSIDIHSK